jgi:hypothetical protein
MNKGLNVLAQIGVAFFLIFLFFFNKQILSKGSLAMIFLFLAVLALGRIILKESKKKSEKQEAIKKRISSYVRSSLAQRYKKIDALKGRSSKDLAKDFADPLMKDEKIDDKITKAMEEKLQEMQGSGKALPQIFNYAVMAEIGEKIAEEIFEKDKYIPASEA